tara:strand:- start:45 stop:389 length:345 start_codon:yes stop_codon:yes gene_type:complete
MGELIQFPTGKKISKPRTEDEIIEEIVNECVDISRHLFDVIDDEIDAISKHDLNLLNGIDLRDELNRESRDAFVIVNLLYSLLVRYIGIEHSLHKDLDKLYVKIKAIHKENDFT